MKVEIEGVEYRVWWRYESHHDCTHQANGTREVTRCFLAANLSDDPVSQTMIVRHFRDPSNRNTARRYSLQRLLSGFWPHAPDVRAKFWAAYRAQLGHW